MKILILHGPNLNLLGSRETMIYGDENLDNINKRLIDLAGYLGVQLDCRHSNHEGELIDILHSAPERFNAIVFNPGAYAHYSIALRDAVAAIPVPVIEVHLSNVYARESFRQKLITAPAAVGVISGLGVMGYLLALRAAFELLKTEGALVCSKD